MCQPWSWLKRRLTTPLLPFPPRLLPLAMTGSRVRSPTTTVCVLLELSAAAAYDDRKNQLPARLTCPEICDCHGRVDLRQESSQYTCKKARRNIYRRRKVPKVDVATASCDWENNTQHERTFGKEHAHCVESRVLFCNSHVSIVVWWTGHLFWKQYPELQSMNLIKPVQWFRLFIS